MATTTVANDISDLNQGESQEAKEITDHLIEKNKSSEQENNVNNV